MRQIIILVTLFVFLGVSGQVANANSTTKSPNHWNTLAQCKAAYASGNYRVYVPTDLVTYKRAIKSTEEPVEIEGDICIQMATVYGYKFVVQEDGTEFLRNKISKKFTARLDCKNPVGEPTYLTQKKIELEEEEEEEPPVKPPTEYLPCAPGKIVTERKQVDGKMATVRTDGCKTEVKFDEVATKCIPGSWSEPRKTKIDGKKVKVKSNGCETIVEKRGGGIPWGWIAGIGGAAVVTYVIVDVLTDDDNSCNTGCGVKVPEKDNSIRTRSGTNNTRPIRILGFDGQPIFREGGGSSSASVVAAPAKPAASKVKATCNSWVGDLCVGYKQ